MCNNPGSGDDLEQDGNDGNVEKWSDFVSVCILFKYL